MIKCKFENNNQASLRHVTVSALIIENNKILLAKRAKKLLEGGKYCFPGGFMDRDETISQTIIREIKEETGYESEIIELFRINTNPFRRGEDRQNVEFSFLAKVGEQVSTPDDESSEIVWFDLDNLPNEEEFAFDHYGTIQLYLKNREGDTKLPIMDL